MDRFGIKRVSPRSAASRAAVDKARTTSLLPSESDPFLAHQDRVAFVDTASFLGG